MKARRNGFTVVEILTVITIIAVLVGILIPSINAVRTMARKTQQTAQLTTIALAISAFKNDYGDYPESDYWNLGNNQRDYSGAQMLTEALLGWDLMGFHPKSEWRADGKYDDGSNPDADLYERATLSSYTDDEQAENLRERKGPYLERAGVKVFHLADLFDDTRRLEGQKTYVISDVFRYKKISDSDTGKTITAGSPILYYKARTNYKAIYPKVQFNESIYDYRDNYRVIEAKSIQDIADDIRVLPHEWTDPDKFYGQAVDYDHSIKDPQITGRDWPYRPDSYLLISAGPDGEYGTIDDITNFR